MKLWGGRFTHQVDDLVNTFNSSISFDSRMYKEDIIGSISHVTMLGEEKIIPKEDSKKIASGLYEILDKLNQGVLKIDNSSEDIHSFIESTLTDYIGEEGKKLHTGIIVSLFSEERFNRVFSRFKISHIKILIYPFKYNLVSKVT